MKALRHPQQVCIFGLGEAAPLDLTIEYFAAELDRGRVLFDAEPLPDFVAGSSRSNVRQPIPARLRGRRSDDLDRLRILQLARQARDASVDAGALAMQSDFRMHGEGEVDWGCTLGQLDHIAGGGENKNLVLVKIELEEL